jgi:hypothetical protein
MPACSTIDDTADAKTTPEFELPPPLKSAQSYLTSCKIWLTLSSSPTECLDKTGCSCGHALSFSKSLGAGFSDYLGTDIRMQGWESALTPSVAYLASSMKGSILLYRLFDVSCECPRPQQ